MDGNSSWNRSLVKGIGGDGQTMDASIVGTIHPKNQRDAHGDAQWLPEQ